METRELYKVTQEFPLTDRAELAIAIKAFEAGLNFTVSRHEILEGRHTDPDGENRRFWKVKFYESVEKLPIRCVPGNPKPQTAKEILRFTLEVPRANSLECEQLVAQACGRRGIASCRSTFEARHDAKGDEIFLASVYERFAAIAV